MADGVNIPTYADILEGCKIYTKNEHRSPMYKVGSKWLAHYWGNPAEMADGLGVVLLTWNSAFYRTHLIDLNLLEECIRKNFNTIESFRKREISSLTSADQGVILSLFNDFLVALEGENAKGKAKTPVGVAKALHLLAPNFFPLWDKKIANGYGCNYDKNSGNVYLEFSLKMQRIADKLKACELLEEKTLLKMIDEYNYSKYTLKLL